MTKEKKENPVDVEETEETVTEKKAPAKKPAAKKEPAKKPNIFKRMWNAIKENRKYIYTGVGGAVVGAGATYGIGKLGEHMANKKAQQNIRQDDNLVD